MVLHTFRPGPRITSNSNSWFPERIAIRSCVTNMSTGEAVPTVHSDERIYRAFGGYESW